MTALLTEQILAQSSEALQLAWHGLCTAVGEPKARETHGKVWAALQALGVEPLPVAEVATGPSQIVITLRQAEKLLAFYGGHDFEAILSEPPEGQPPGLYCWCRDYPGEGGDFLGATEVDDELASQGRQLASDGFVPVSKVVPADSALAAINFALDTTEGIEFLRAWREGSWDTIQKEWPEAPADVIVDAPCGDGDYLSARLTAALQLQPRVLPWLHACFGPAIAGDKQERNHRFLEESLELVQTTGCTAYEAHRLVEYVFGRPVGEPVQEVGGVMITLAALCLANGLNMHAAGEQELARIWPLVEKIRAKQKAKPKHSPLPIVIDGDTAEQRLLTVIPRICVDNAVEGLNDAVATGVGKSEMRDLVNGALNSLRRAQAALPLEVGSA